jgi:hypothetical protein
MILLFGVMNASQPPQPSQPPRPQSAPQPRPEVQPLLKQLAALPDLLFLARDQAKGGDAYALQKKLEREYRAAKKPFKITVVYRHLERCSTKEHQFGAAEILIVNPKGDSVKLDGMARHESEAHGAAFPAAVAAFLRNLPDTQAAATAPASGLAIVEFPGSISIERDIPDAYADLPKSDSRWAVPKALRFSPPSQVSVGDGPDGPIRIEAWLSNPTAHPVKAVLWQVGHDDPFHLGLIEDALLKRKPPDPDMPPQPPPVIPVPLPPIRITVPAKTAIRFVSEMYLAGYDFKSGGAAKAEWSFHYWKAPEERGTLAFTLPKR